MGIAPITVMFAIWLEYYVSLYMHLKMWSKWRKVMLKQLLDSAIVNMIGLYSAWRFMEDSLIGGMPSIYFILFSDWFPFSTQ